MQTSRYVVVYDSSDMQSIRHLIPRNAIDEPCVCGERLGGRRNIRRAAHEGVPADCMGCLINHAREVAEMAHRGQYDFDGSFHIDHVAEVAGACAHSIVHRDEAIVVGWLHDVLEDSSWTPRRLREERFPEYIVEAVWLLTWDRLKQTREQYIRRIAQAHGLEGELAKIAKRSDLIRNMMRSRAQGKEERANRYHTEIAEIDRSRLARTPSRTSTRCTS